jgi:peptidoglycan hydrolase CwlO-like protein
MSKIAPIFQDLDNHIKECDYRYRKLEEKIDQVDQRLDRIEHLIIELKDSLKH